MMAMRDVVVEEARMLVFSRESQRVSIHVESTLMEERAVMGTHAKGLEQHQQKQSITLSHCPPSRGREDELGNLAQNRYHMAMRHACDKLTIDPVIKATTCLGSPWYCVTQWWIEGE